MMSSYKTNFNPSLYKSENSLFSITYALKTKTWKRFFYLNMEKTPTVFLFFPLGSFIDKSQIRIDALPAINNIASAFVDVYYNI